MRATRVFVRAGYFALIAFFVAITFISMVTKRQPPDLYSVVHMGGDRHD
jgi:hypothetical protein